MNRLRWQWQEFPYSATEKICAFKTTLTFVDSVSEIWGPLLNGLVLLIIPRLITKDPQQLAKILDNEKVEYFDNKKGKRNIYLFIYLINSIN